MGMFSLGEIQNSCAKLNFPSGKHPHSLGGDPRCHTRLSLTFHSFFVFFTEYFPNNVENSYTSPKTFLTANESGDQAVVIVKTVFVIDIWLVQFGRVFLTPFSRRLVGGFSIDNLVTLVPSFDPIFSALVLLLFCQKNMSLLPVLLNKQLGYIFQYSPAGLY